MADAWSPTFPVDRALAGRLIAHRFPHLNVDDLEKVGVGWDHEVWRCGDVLFRFPHQRDGLTAAKEKASALTHLGPLLPLAVPMPVLYGQPTAEYPGHFVGYRWLDGQLPARLPLTAQERARAAPALARFTRTLHALPVAQATGWGLVQEGPRGSMRERAVSGRQRADQLKDTAFTDLAHRAAAAMDPPPAECVDHERRVVHGDLHAGQVLFDAQHRLVGVIDWDSTAIGDPAFDLIMVYAFLPPSARAVFWAEYGVSSAARRARHLALSYGLALLAQGVATGDTAVRDEAAFSLKNALP